MAQIVWTEPALIDLDAIAEYIALDKPDAANRLVKKIFTNIKRLEEFPNSGRKPPELGQSRYFEIIVNPCQIFYRIESKKIYILYVMRSERKLRQYVLKSRDES